MAKQQKPKEFYLYDAQGVYLGPIESAECPANATDKKPPYVSETDKSPVFNGSEWTVWKNEDVIKATQVRALRDKLLAASDYTQLQDSPVDVKAWAEYRKELRDMPNQKGWPNVELPKPPAHGPAVTLKS